MWLVGIIICGGWIFSLCLHEFSHAIVAYWGGDTSVKEKGYLTFNPLRYTDPGYSVALPLLFLLMGGMGLPGGAVYINQHRLRSRWWQTAVSAAGPTANIVMALVLTVIFGLFAGNSFDLYAGNNLVMTRRIDDDSFVSIGIAFLIYLQVFATIFNLLPIPGLDGYGIIEPWLPAQLRAQLNQLSKYSTLIIIGLFWYVPWFSQTTTKCVGLITNKFLNIPDAAIWMGSSSFRQPINQLITLIILIAFGWSLNCHKRSPLAKRQKFGTKKVVKSNPNRQKFGTKNAEIIADPVKRSTRNRVSLLAGRDVKRIERLLDLARRNHPNLSEQWYWEKILYDLQRDRR